MRVPCHGALLLAMLCLLWSSRSSAKDIVETPAPQVVVNWTRATIQVRRGGIARATAPTASVARIRAERRAIERARSRARQVAMSLPWASDDQPLLSQQSALPSRVSQVDYASDGSVLATVEFPIEGLRQAVVGFSKVEPQALPQAAVIVDARDLNIAPAVGRSLLVKGKVHDGPSFYVDSEQRAKSDPRVRQLPRVFAARALSVEKGSLAVDLPHELGSEPLIVIIIAAPP